MISNRQLRDLRPLSHVEKSHISAHSCAFGSAYPNALRDKGGCNDSAVNTVQSQICGDGE